MPPQLVGWGGFLYIFALVFWRRLCYSNGGENLYGGPRCRKRSCFVCMMKLF
nr:MAG TPA: hypothetical protein [Caudoviricetes sp.]